MRKCNRAGCESVESTPSRRRTDRASPVVSFLKCVEVFQATAEACLPCICAAALA